MADTKQDRYDQLFDLMESEASREQVKHTLQFIVAAEVREAVSAGFRSGFGTLEEDEFKALRLRVQEGWKNVEEGGVLDKAAQLIVDKLSSEEKAQLVSRMSAQAAQTQEWQAVYDAAKEIVEEHREEILDKLTAAIANTADNALREERDFYKRGKELADEQIQSHIYSSTAHNR